ncbi:MAG: Late competence protein ComEA, DNA receptor [uncultured Nocardioidaceae bacterium]|uniref:Late competence protein ComEA, DNA receptor n=1 Tax=uncultured Nocardioidaceae bacterium TaxID=253824 RepID=A0A6J4MLY5_9ACTN|nr:MAG: Late competence protein ComEA, DNA receptor [uncultured Nocardioidaceae bacterium]
MRSRKAANDQVAEVARRRLELLSAELAGIQRALPPDEASRPDPIAAVESAEAVVGGRHAHRSIGPGGRVGGWVHDRLPATMQGSVRLTSTHVSVVALLVAAAMAAATWWVLRADGPGMVVPAPVPSPAGSPLVELSGTPPPEAAAPAGGSSPIVGGAPAAPGATAVGQVVIDVAGKVRRPGIARLPAGSRVADALRSAGGARKGVDLATLNLARVLVDGEQIVVGVPPPTGVAPPAASAPTTTASGAPIELVNINTADQVALETLPGVGPVTAQAIMTWRTENGAFSSVDELLEISGIGDATLAEMAPYVTV